MKKTLFVLSACAALAACGDSASAGRLVGGLVRGFLGGPTPPPPPPPPAVVMPQPVVIQQPVMIQPTTVTVPQPVTVQQPVAAPQPAAPAVATTPPPLTDLSVKKVEIPPAAAPKVSAWRIEFKAPATAEMVAAARTQFAAEKGSPERLTLMFSKVDDATFVAALAAFPESREVVVDESEVTSLSALAPMKNLTRLALKNMSLPDLTPLASLTTLEKLDFSYSAIANLTPVGSLPNVTYISFYGASLADFSPLASMPKLNEIWFYAVKTSEAGYQSLGNLKQVKVFHGGLTKMTSLAWVANVPQIEELHVFAEPIADFSPVATAKNLTFFRAWDISTKGLHKRPLGDISFLASCPKLTTVELPSCEFTGLEALARLPQLQSVDLTSATSPLDLAPLAGAAALEKVDIGGSTVSHAEVLASLPKLKTLRMSKTKGVTSILPFGAAPSLTSLTVKEGAFPPQEIAAVNAARQAKHPSFKVNEY